ncbi:MAG TPA: ATP-binding protein [Gaiellaceae bacterium]
MTVREGPVHSPRAEAPGASFRELIENLPLVTYADSAGDERRTIYVSPQMEQMLGYPAEDWLRDPDMLLRVLHPDDLERIRTHRGTQQDRDTSQIFRVVSRDGRVYTVQSERVVVRDEEGRARFTQGFWIDITDRVRIEEELREAQKREAVGRLAGAVAHDFNNILTAIAGAADLARANLDDPTALGRALDAIDQAAQTGSSLSRQLLTLGRNEPRVTTRTQLNEVIRSTMALLERLIPSSIEVELVLGEPLPEVATDRSRLGQIVLNLTLNARDAMPDGGRLTIRTGARGGRVELVVVDTGIGMDDEVRARAFDHFFTTKGVDGGTGLGLATVREIVEAGQGDIELESAPGAGTTMRIAFPPA